MDNATPQSPDLSSQRIDLIRQLDVSYWCSVLDVTPAQLRGAVQHVGHHLPDVRHYLQSRAAQANG